MGYEFEEIWRGHIVVLHHDGFVVVAEYLGHAVDGRYGKALVRLLLLDDNIAEAGYAVYVGAHGGYLGFVGIGGSGLGAVGEDVERAVFGFSIAKQALDCLTGMLRAVVYEKYYGG